MNNKKKIALILICLMALAFAVRFYHFHDWLYFKMDQARDAMLIRTALENGSGYLPLLGPRAGATEVSGGYLRLGPIFYYFQYFSALIFGLDSPATLAYPDLFFSILAIPALYFLSRVYLSRFHSLLVAAMYALSFIIIQYSRFAWNPNSLSFFAILCFLGLLKFLADGKIRWLALWAGSLAIGSQLHFFGFFALVGISGLLIAHHLEIWKKDFWKTLFSAQVARLSAKYALAVVMIFSIFYFPAILSDFKKGGENAKNFIEALSSKPKDKPFIEKLGQNAERNVKYFCLITTAGCYKGDAQDDPDNSAITIILIFFGLAAAAYFWKKEGPTANRNFPALLLIWFAVFFVLTIPVSFQLRPRFFILVFPLIFLLIGIAFKCAQEKFPARGKTIALAVSALVILLNIRGTAAWFQEQALSQEKNLKVNRTLILKTKDGVTLGQLERAADYMAARRNRNQAGYFYAKPEHIAPFKYLLSERKVADISPIEKIKDTDGQYFAIGPADRGMDPFEKKFGQIYEIISSEQFGQISVFELKVKGAAENNNVKEEADDEDLLEEEPSTSDRLFWKDVL